MLFLGNEQYSPLKGYAQLQGDFNNCSSSIIVDEGRIIGWDGNGYAMLAKASAITDIARQNEFKPGTPICVLFHKNTYYRWTKDNPRTECKPTQIELALIDYFDNNGKEFVNNLVEGEVNISSNPTVLKAFSEQKLINLLVDLKIIKNANAGTLAIPEITNRGTTGTGARNTSQATAQKLVEKQEFILKNIRIDFDEKSGSSLMEAAHALKMFREALPDTYLEYTQLLSMILDNR